MYTENNTTMNRIQKYIQCWGLKTDERAVSPVIGVVLMIAIAFAIATVVGTVVLGAGSGISEDTPDIDIGFNYDESQNQVEVFHSGGEDITADNIFQIEIVFVDSEGDPMELTPTNIGGQDPYIPDDASNPTEFDETTDPVVSGQLISVVDNVEESVTGADEIRVVWVSKSGSRSATLGAFRPT